MTDPDERAAKHHAELRRKLSALIEKEEFHKEGDLAPIEALTTFMYINYEEIETAISWGLDCHAKLVALRKTVEPR